MNLFFCCNRVSDRCRWALKTLSVVLVLGSSQPGFGDSEPILAMDFSGEAGTAAYQWLDKKSFVLKHDANDPDKIEIFHGQGALHLRAKKPAFGMVIHEGDVIGAKRMLVHWGVADYPDGASYQQGVDNEAIMIYVFFGHERQPSGELLVPDSPYFIGFYLCQAGTDELEQPYLGHHFKKTGRFICLDHPPEGETAVEEVDLEAEFLNNFDLDRVPDVSGISIEVDTTEADNDGHAAAFLQRLEFLN
jgi:hypothetical protein